MTTYDSEELKSVVKPPTLFKNSPTNPSKKF